MNDGNRRYTDGDILSRLATLEAQRVSDDERVREYHKMNQDAIADLVRQVSLSNNKMDIMLEAIHMAKGGWWAAGKIIGLILGIVSGIGMVVGALWWAFQHISIRA